MVTCLDFLHLHQSHSGTTKNTITQSSQLKYESQFHHTSADIRKISVWIYALHVSMSLKNKTKKRQPHLPKNKVEAEEHKSQDLGTCYFTFQQTHSHECTYALPLFSLPHVIILVTQNKTQKVKHEKVYQKHSIYL